MHKLSVHYYILSPKDFLCAQISLQRNFYDLYLRGGQIARFLPLETSVPFPRTNASSVLYDVYDMRLESFPEVPLPIPSPFRVSILVGVAST